MKLSVIIVNYNVRHFLEQALRSVRKASEGLEVEVFVVDNNSVDGSVEMVRTQFPEVQLIANDYNPGFAKANNQAIRRARGEYVLLLNPDTVVHEDTFRQCIAFMDAHPEAGALGVRMIDGSGAFLPESKRGFPSPWVAFCKTFGLARLFPRSRLFNHYHLGYLDEHQVHQVEVLAGAFMFLRKRVLDEVGLLDEDFFMYGEDIDLSWRIVQAGYKNYYFPHTSIIHYKGESTKKGSLNYVRAFYQAMIIFARKHFKGRQARLFVWMLQGAIYFRALLTLLGNFVRKAWLPLADAALMAGGMVLLKNYWATHYFHNPDYYPPSFLWFNIPLYTLVWLGSLYFTGAYDEPFRLRRLVRGMLTGTLLLAAIYGFLPLQYRPSRALILLGAAWGVLSMSALRTLVHLLRTGNLNVGYERDKNLVIVGRQDESQRVQQLLQRAGVQANVIGTVAPREVRDLRERQGYLSALDKLDQVVHIFRVDELIFCARDVPSGKIMEWMTRLGPHIHYKIVPEDSLSIIGSHSRDHAGELYTIEIRYQIAHPTARRAKRLFDLGLALALLLAFPLAALYTRQPKGLWQNIRSVLLGRCSWVGYAPVSSRAATAVLPPLRPGVLSPLDALRIPAPDELTIQRLNLLYAKDYHLSDDLNIAWKGRRQLGRVPPRCRK